MSRIQLAEAAELTELTIFNIEHQITTPQMDVRRRLEIVFNQRINWLTTSGVQTDGDQLLWEEVETAYRRVALQINQLPVQERSAFLQVAREYLNDIEVIVEEEEEKLNVNVLLPTEISAIKLNRKRD